MRFNVQSKIKQVKWGREYNGWIRIGNKYLEYSAVFPEGLDSSTDPSANSTVDADVTFSDKNGKKTPRNQNIEDRISGYLVGSIVKFFNELNRMKVKDNLLGGVLRQEVYDQGIVPHEVISSKVSMEFKYKIGLDDLLSSNIEPQDIKRFFSDSS